MSPPAPRVVGPRQGGFITRAAKIDLRPAAPPPVTSPASPDASFLFLSQFLVLNIDEHAFQASPLDAVKRAADVAGRPNGIGEIAAMPEWERMLQASIKIVALSRDFAKLPKPLRQGVIIVARPLRSSGRSKAEPLLVAECEIAGVGLHGVKAQSFREAMGGAGRIVWIGD